LAVSQSPIAWERGGKSEREKERWYLDVEDLEEGLVLVLESVDEEGGLLVPVLGAGDGGHDGLDLDAPGGVRLAVGLHLAPAVEVLQVLLQVLAQQRPGWFEPTKKGGCVSS
jgi:hypothetical protein